jgi:UDP-N-acetylglucosamine 2-epimerase (non-hydrolysing)
MRIITVVGARPNFMKAAPIIASIRKHNETEGRADASVARPASGLRIDHILVHTGQHYDPLMSDSFFVDLKLPPPDIRLGVGSASHAVQTAEVLKAFEEVLLHHRPDVVIVVGDVNSTIACALATAKISFDSVGTRPLLAHVEAGLRSFDRSMPEEVNRVLTDHLCDLLFVTEDSAIENLNNEGISPQAIHFVGNTMIDSLLAFKEKAEASTILERLKLRAPASVDRNGRPVSRYALLTLHRPSNVDNRDTFLNILRGLEELAADCPVVFPVHPRTRQRIKEFGLDLRSGIPATEMMADAQNLGSESRGLILTDPLGYLDFLCLMKHAMIVVTDSGGIQEETTCLMVPCVTVRENTERPVTIDSGTNIIAGTSDERIKIAIRQQIGRKGGNRIPKKWDGQAASRIVDILISSHSERISSQTPDSGCDAKAVCAHQI